MLLIKTRKKVLIILSLGLIVTPSLIAVACSSNITDELGQNEIMINKKTIKYTALDKYSFDTIKNSNDIKSILIKPISINSSKKLSNFLKEWKDKFLNNKSSKPDSNLDYWRNLINNLIKRIEIKYSKTWFSKNTLIVDFGGYIGAKIINDNSPTTLKKNVIDNLKNIFVNNNTIEIVYEHNYQKDSINDWKIKYYPVLYEINNDEFNLENNVEYKVKKTTTTTTRAVWNYERKYNAGSYLNFSNHGHSDEGKSEWKYSLDSTQNRKNRPVINDQFAAILVKSSRELKNILNPNSLKDEVSDKVMSEFNDEFFKENILSLISIIDWITNFESGTEYTSDYNAIIENNDFNITLYKIGRIDLPFVRTNPRIFTKGKTIWDNIPIEPHDSYDATLFIPIKKSEFSDFRLAETNLNVVFYNPYSE
ncbi:hypothetical protein [Mycoplasmopsis agassizii]|uniref:Lipoprotein n=1 Tax=Mycoplasmopsis agassizii TaxID=33922 RepID=A0ABX4H5K2_9BACT|nr:hypothetical protein [Mycoplasmopsis agassizii]PAF55145.1 hypothetical protein CJF60_00465 [Mycoplasmopsis agassizii]SMC16758.1 hypothetical protein SAMN02745179_00316 [Mycoplasmopsis agassizii]